MILSRTPFRISFFGGGTDYPVWYTEHGGEILATTIDKYCYLTCRYLPPFFEHRYRIVWSIIESCKSIEDIRHPVVGQVLKYLGIDRGVEIHHDGDLPARSGMGSSSAFTVGLLHALYALKGSMPEKKRLAQESMRIEQEILRETVGSQDQILAAYGGLNHILFSKDGTFILNPVTIQEGRKEELNAHLMLFFTGIKRTASNIARSYISKVEEKSAQLAALQGMVEEGLRILTSGEDICTFGKLLHEAWKVKRSLSESVSNTAIDDLYAYAQSQGAIGGKITGAGGGGFLLLFVDPACREKVRQALRDLIFVPFRFETSGSQIILYDREQEYADEDIERRMAQE